MPDQQKSLTAATAFRFVLILGIANGFADLTYEGARSVTGQFLGYLGASAALIGFTAGLGELLGYTLRSFAVTSAIKRASTGWLRSSVTL